MPLDRIASKMNNKLNTKPRYIADRLIEIRQEFNLSQKDVAAMIGVTGAAVQQAEQFNRDLLFEIIILYSIRYKLSPNWIIIEDNSNEEKFLQKESPADLSPDQLLMRIKRDATHLKDLAEKAKSGKKK